ncbi:hypothetical protein Trydic_g12777 [Trypoxylus dichotomus]
MIIFMHYTASYIVNKDLGPCWWPGEIVSFGDLPTDITESFKKPPLAVVKFFDEEKYEFVKQLSNIASYNSSKKYDHIRKGLDLYRAKHSFMEKFRGDVVTAEKKINGDPNILSDPKLEPEKKPNYANIFGSPVPKKSKDSPARGRGRGSSGRSHASPGSARKMTSLITHPRFLGKDDSEIRKLVQTPVEAKIPEPEYKCYSCGFKSNRIEVIVFHNKSHLRGNCSPQSSPKKIKKSPPKRTKKRRFPMSKTLTIDEDLELLRQGLPVCSDDSSDDESSISSSSSSPTTSSSDEEPLVKRKPKVTKPPPKPKKPPPPVVEVKKKTDICTDLLAEWDDDEEEEEDQPVSERLSAKPATPAEIQEDKKNPQKIDEKEKSCFDFDEDIEEDLVTTIEGRKIPRVIPQTDRRKSVQDITGKSRSPSPKSIEDNIIESESDKPNDDKEVNIQNNTSNGESVERKKDSQFQMEFEAFNEALKETVVPKIPDIPLLHKYEQNFHNAKTIKFPDKLEEKEPTVSPTPAKDISPSPPILEKENTIVSDEEKSVNSNKVEIDVEPPLVETPVEQPPVEPSVEPPVEPPIPESPLLETAVELSAAELPTVEPPVELPTVEPPVETIKEPTMVKNTEVATKLTNPKKRFVKTFEDETKNSKEKVTTKEDVGRDIIEPDVKYQLKSLEVSKLKTQLMKKLGDASPKKENKQEYAKHTDKPNPKKGTVTRGSRRTRTFVEIAKLEPIESRDNKRSISETAIDKETKTYVKKKKYTSDFFQESNNTQDTIAVDVVDETTKDVERQSGEKEMQDLSLEQTREDTVHESSSLLDYINTSPTKIFKDLRVDTELLIDAASLSESQKLTIQNIIGITSPVLPSQPPINSMQEAQKQDEPTRPKTPKEIPSIFETTVENQIPDKIEKMDTEESSTENKDTQKEIDDKLKPETTDAFRADVLEDKAEHMPANNQIFDVSEKLNEAITEKLPDEIIETSEEPSNRKSEDRITERQQEISESEKLADEPEKPMVIEKMDTSTEEIQKQSVDEFEKEITTEESKGAAQESPEKETSQIETVVMVEGNIAELVREDKVEKSIEEKIESIVEGVTKDEPKEAIINQIEKLKEEIPEEKIIEKVTCETDEKIEKPNSPRQNETTQKQNETSTEESLEKIKDNTKPDLPVTLEETLGKTTTEIVKSLWEDDTMVNIEGNLTVVTESDLADKQVEIATTPEASKPITLSSFSMDFCEDVESYVKGETIIQAQDKPISISPMAEKKLVELTEVLMTEGSETKAKKRKIDKEKLSLDTQLLERKEDIKMKKFDDVLTPAKEVPPSVIMEGTEEPVKDDVTDDTLTIDESDLKESVPPKESAIEKPNVIIEKVEKVIVEENKNDLYQTRTNQDIIKEISQKEEIIIPPMDISVESEVAKITDSIAEQEVVIQDNHHSTTSTKLLEILTDKPKSNSTPKSSPILSTIPQTEKPSMTTAKPPYKHSKLISKQPIPGPSKTPKATILSDKLIKPLDESKTVSVKKVTSKRSYQDVEDIDTYIIQKPIKKLNISVDSELSTPKIIKKPPAISKGKARILQQTIITPTGDILQPPVSQSTQDDNMFDINSMPIVLSDQILTPEGIENMQIVLQETPVTTASKAQISPIKKTQITQPQQQVKLLNKTQAPVGLGLKETILKTPIQKSSAVTATQPGKPGKFIIVPATTTATGPKYTVGKKPAIVKKSPEKILTPINKISDSPMTSTSGSKVMIVKGQQGQQQKILLTPQKQTPSPKIRTRTIAHKQILAKDLPQQKGANIISQTIVNSKGQITTLANQSLIGARNQQIVTAAVAQQSRNIKLDPIKMKRTQQRVSLANEITKPGTSGQHRTIIIKNPQGQTVKKIQGTDDALLDQQVAEQLQAISRASANQQLKELSPRTTSKAAIKKPYAKRQESIKQSTFTKTITQTTKNVSVPPLAPISPTKKITETAHYTPATGEIPVVEGKLEETKRPPHQLVIQDAQVTLDETGNLTPLNSEALMSLDPNLNLTSDLGNMVLQIDQGTTTESEPQVADASQQQHSPQIEAANTENLLLKEAVNKPPAVENVLLTDNPSTEPAEQNVQAVINSGEMGQLIITGDPAAAQKFLESLAEGNADLANLLANAEGNVLIQADGQQILINTDSENPMLVMNPESISNENSEGSGNPIFANQPVKNQDILAAALADTDVFQQDQSISHSPSKVAQSQLSPNSSLYPMNVTNVLETNSMSSPIMTPLEVPSTNSKKIGDESEILNQVPKNVDLPITITDPNISQTVSQQQVASLMASELQTNLDLPLAIQDPGLSVTSAEMSSPSFVYSLPTLDDTVDLNQKAFSGSISMPLLTEEPEDPISESSSSTGARSIKERKLETDAGDKKETEKNDKDIAGESSTENAESKEDKKTDFLSSGGLCAMRGGICNSLSEPPPDMFDFSVENQYEPSHISRPREMDIPMGSMPRSETTNALNDRESSVSSVEGRKNDDSALYTVNTTSPSTNTDDSCEIPVQPPIIAKPFEENGTSDSKIDGDKMATDGDV